MSSIFYFNTPDSARYLILQEGYSQEDLDKFLETKKSEIDKGVTKIRVIFNKSEDKYNLKKSFSILSKNLNNQFEIKDYDTNFFKINKQRLNQVCTNFPLACWDTYESQFSYEKVVDNSQAELLKQIMVESFGNSYFMEEGEIIIEPKPIKIQKIKEKIKLSLGDSKTHALIIKDKNKQIVGSLSLVNLGEDIQIHSVGGRYSQSKFQGKKLPVLVASGLEYWRQNFSESKYCSLSSSKQKLAKAYQDLGFSFFEGRCGLIFTRIN